MIIRDGLYKIKPPEQEHQGERQPRMNTSVQPASERPPTSDPAVRSTAWFGGVRLVRVWDMPHKHTFRIPTVKCLLRRFMESGRGWADPFANDRSPAEHTNDLNPETSAKSHMDAVDFLKTFDANSLNGVLLDPPYSMHQCTVSYEGYGTGRVIALTPVYDEAARIVKPGGLVLTFGWNSNGIGIGRNFEMLEVVLIPHGGHHNDTLVTVERKLEAAPELWAKPPNQLIGLGSFT